MKNSSYMIGIAAMMLVAAFAGICVTADDASAEGDAYILNYEVGDKTVVISSTVDTVELKMFKDIGAIAPEGKTFDKWVINGKNYDAGSTYVFAETGTINVTVKWAEITYTAQFVVGDAVTDVTGTLAEAKDLSVLAPADPAKEGYIFAGWLAEGAEAPVAKGDLGVLKTDVVYTAVFDVDWKVTFVDGDKSFIGKVSDFSVPVLGIREGFTFIGWFVGTEQVKDPTAYEFAADTVFEAKWEPMNCTVTFTAGGEVFATATVLYGKTVVMPALPDGYSAWDFDFTTPVKSDISISAIEAEAPEPAFYETPTGKCVIILAVFVIGFLAYQIYTGNLAEVLGKGKKKKKAVKDVEPVDDDEDDGGDEE